MGKEPLLIRSRNVNIARRGPRIEFVEDRDHLDQLLGPAVKNDPPRVRARLRERDLELPG